MNKLLFWIFIASIVCQEMPEKLYGDNFANAVLILNNALNQLRHKGGPNLTLRAVEAAFKLIPHIIYTFDTELLVPDGSFQLCIVEVSLSQLKVKNTLVVITCDGNEVLRKVLNSTIEV